MPRVTSPATHKVKFGTHASYRSMSLDLEGEQRALSTARPKARPHHRTREPGPPILSNARHRRTRTKALSEPIPPPGTHSSHRLNVPGLPLPVVKLPEAGLSRRGTTNRRSVRPAGSPFQVRNANENGQLQTPSPLLLNPLVTNTRSPPPISSSPSTIHSAPSPSPAPRRTPAGPVQMYNLTSQPVWSPFYYQPQQSFIPYVTPAYLPGGGGTYPYYHETPYHHWPSPFVPQQFFDFQDLGAALPPVEVYSMPSIHPELSTYPVRWNILTPPTKAKANRDYDYYDQRPGSGSAWGHLGRWASEHACSGAEVLAIHFEHLKPHLRHQLCQWWGPIVVVKNSEREITVEQALQAIYSFFQQRFTDEENAALPLLDHNFVFASRFKRVGSDPRRCRGGEEEAPLLRVDLFDGVVDFKGLRFLGVDGNRQVDLALELGMNAKWAQWPQ